MTERVCSVCYGDNRVVRREIAISKYQRTRWHVVDACQECWCIFETMIAEAEVSAIQPRLRGPGKMPALEVT